MMQVLGHESATMAVASPIQSEGAAAGQGRRSIVRSLAALARRTETFKRSLPTIVKNAVIHSNTFPEILSLIRLQPFSDVVRQNPRFILRCLTRDYLVRGLSVGLGARCFLYHHHRMQMALPKNLLQELTLSQVTLYEASDENTHVSVALGQTCAPHDKEGELDLRLQVDGKTVFLLSFSIVPGHVVGSRADEVVLISRMQGVLGCYPEIKLARKVLADVAPNALLLSALQGVAVALGVDELACVSSTQQSVYREEIADRLHRAYEEFFADLGVEQNEAGFFSSSMPLAEKPMTSIKAGHKLRTKQKRALKAAVMTACLDFFRAGMAGASCAMKSRPQRERVFGRHVWPVFEAAGATMGDAHS